MKIKLTTWILIAMVAGVGVGWMCHELLPTPETAKVVAGYISLFTDVFLRLIKMIIAPLVFATLVVGIAHMGDSSSLGRIGLKTMGWFVSASLMSLVVGMILGAMGQKMIEENLTSAKKSSENPESKSAPDGR